MYRHPEPNGRGFWAVTKYDDVLAVLRDTKTFSSEVGGSAPSAYCGPAITNR